MNNPKPTQLPPAGPEGHFLKSLRELAPEAFADGKLDLDRLRVTAGLTAPLAEDRYRFTWAGKEQALQMLHAPIRSTLRPRAELSVDWPSTGNIVIQGDNLEVLKQLHRSYFSRIRLIYIAPPYNADGSRLFCDNPEDPLAPYLRLLANPEEWTVSLQLNPESNPHHHSVWLSMIYPRLALARHLLREDGFLAISIDDHELHHLRIVLNELFGEENHVATLVVETSRKNDAKLFSLGHEYVVVYARNAQHLKDTNVVLRMPKEGIDEVRELWGRLREEHGSDYAAIAAAFRAFTKSIPADDPRAPLKRYRKVDAAGPFRDDADISWHGGDGPRYEVLHPVTGRPCKVPRRGWIYPTHERMQEKIADGTVVFGPDETTVPARRTYLLTKTLEVMPSVLYSYSQTATQDFRAIFDGALVFENAKHFADIAAIIDYLTDDGDIILDFFAGSGSTGHAVLDSNRRSGSRRQFILVQLQEPIDPTSRAGAAAGALELRTITELCRERLRRSVSRLPAPQGSDAAPTSEDTGFRVFELTESHVQPWPSQPLTAETLELFVDRVRVGTSDRDLLWEVVLREGFPLSSQVIALSGAHERVYRVTDPLSERSFFAHLGSSVRSDLPTELGMSPQQTLVCREHALTDEQSIGLSMRCRLRTI